MAGILAESSTKEIPQFPRCGIEPKEDKTISQRSGAGILAESRRPEISEFLRCGEPASQKTRFTQRGFFEPLRCTETAKTVETGKITEAA